MIIVKDFVVIWVEWVKMDEGFRFGGRFEEGGFGEVELVRNELYLVGGEVGGCIVNDGERVVVVGGGGEDVYNGEWDVWYGEYDFVLW